MNLDDKIKKLKQLQKIDYPSDQEREEIEILKGDILEITKEVQSTYEDKPKSQPQQEPKKETSILKKILRLTPKEPVTQAELDQLKLVAQKEELKARIAKAKSAGPSIFDSISKVIGKSSNNPFDLSSTPTKQKRSDYDPFRW